MVDMMNNAGFGSISTNMPAITQANDPWSLTLRRPALLEERFEAQGFPMVFPEQTLGLDRPFNVRDLGITRTQASSLAGNAMHFSALAMVVSYMLVFTEMQRPAE